MIMSDFTHVAAICLCPASITTDAAAAAAGS